jgi:hypothetical protein
VWSIIDDFHVLEGAALGAVPHDRRAGPFFVVDDVDGFELIAALVKDERPRF